MLFLRAADGRIPFMRQYCDPINAVKAFGKLIVGLHPGGGPLQSGAMALSISSLFALCPGKMRQPYAARHVRRLSLAESKTIQPGLSRKTRADGAMSAAERTSVADKILVFGPRKPLGDIKYNHDAVDDGSGCCEWGSSGTRM
jgi:hypothetical protein